MLEEVLRYLKNWFVTEIWAGTFTVQDESISLDFLQENQYFRIIGSVFNDGVYQYTDSLKLVDETFDGAVWVLAVPKKVLEIVSEIESWNDKFGEATTGPYTSESFGGYSYSKASGSDGGLASWRDVFKAKLAPWRKAMDVSTVGASAYQSPPYKRPFNPDFPHWEG